MSTPAERLGVSNISPESMEELYHSQSRLLTLDDPKTDPQSHGLSWFALAAGAMSSSFLVANSYYLDGKWTPCADWCRKAGDATVYFLLGDWRRKEPYKPGVINPDAWFERKPNLSWAIYLSAGLAWSSVGQHWDIVDRLLMFPTERILPDDDGKAVHGYFLGLARWWKNAADIGWTEQVKGIGGAGSKGPRLLCDVVAAIATDDSAAAANGLQKYVQWFLKKRDHDEQFPLDATFLWQVARHRGMSLNLSEEYDKFLFRLPVEK